MLKITLEGPMASGKTLMRHIIECNTSEVSTKTGHQIEIIELLTDVKGSEDDVPAGPAFKVFRFKASGKFDTEFLLEVPDAKRMDQVCDHLRKSKKLPAGYSMVIVAAQNNAGEAFFYPCEVK